MPEENVPIPPAAAPAAPLQGAALAARVRELAAARVNSPDPASLELGSPAQDTAFIEGGRLDDTAMMDLTFSFWGG